jgi:hypothetical protein
LCSDREAPHRAIVHGMSETSSPPTVFRGPFPGRPMHHVSYGLARVQGADDIDAWQLALPKTGRFTHLTAAAAYGWWLPEVTDRLPTFIAVDAKRSRVIRSSVRCIRTDPTGPPLTRDDRRLDPPADVLLNAARDCSLLDTIVLASAALFKEHCTIDELTEAATRRRRGAPRLRHALKYADGRCESAWEVLMLVLHLLGGYEVEPQFVVANKDGEEVGRLDLLLVSSGDGHEYDGAHHLPRRQQDKDLARLRRLAAVGVTRRGYTDKDVVNRPHGILRDCELATGQAPTPGAASRWLRMLSDSSYTAPGRARLERRCWTQSST